MSARVIPRPREPPYAALPEALNSERKGQLLHTVEDGVYLLGIGIHSGGVSIGNHSQYSCSFSIVNIPRELGEKLDGLTSLRFHRSQT